MSDMTVTQDDDLLCEHVLIHHMDPLHCVVRHLTIIMYEQSGVAGGVDELPGSKNNLDVN